MSDSTNPPPTDKGKGKAPQADTPSAASTLTSSIINSAASLAKSVLDPRAASQSLSESQASRSATGSGKGESSSFRSTPSTGLDGGSHTEAQPTWTTTTDGPSEATILGGPPSSTFRTGGPSTATTQSDFEHFSSGHGLPIAYPQDYTHPHFPRAQEIGPLKSSQWRTPAEREAYLQSQHLESHWTPPARVDGADVLDLLTSTEDPAGATTMEEVYADDLLPPVPNPVEEQQLPDLNHPDVREFVRCDDIVEFLSMRPGESWGYSEEVWGDAVGLVRGAVEEMKDMELERELGLETEPVVPRAVERLKLLQGHLRSKL